MKEAELRELSTCACCHKKLGQCGGLPIFWKATIQRHVLDVQAVQRQSGLGSFLGNGLLAQHMGPNEEMTQPLTEQITVMVCDNCAMRGANLHVIAEGAAKNGD